MGHICGGVTEQADVDGLNTLVVWNNQISHQSMPALSRALVSGSLVAAAVWDLYEL